MQCIGEGCTAGPKVIDYYYYCITVDRLRVIYYALTSRSLRIKVSNKYSRLVACVADAAAVQLQEDLFHDFIVGY